MDVQIKSVGESLVKLTLSKTSRRNVQSLCKSLSPTYTRRAH